MYPYDPPPRQTLREWWITWYPTIILAAIFIGFFLLIMAGMEAIGF